MKRRQKMFFLLSQRQKNRRIKLLVDKDLASCQDSTPNNSGDKRLESSAVESFNNNDGSNENKFRGNHMSVYGSNSYEEEVNDDIELLHDVSFENVEETDDGEDEKKGFESIDEDVGVNKTAGQNTCCDHCKDVNRIVLHKLDQIIEMLNATGFNVGNPNLRDFSRLGNNFPLHTIDEVENFEKQLKQDDSLMELYKVKIGTIGGDSPEAAVRNALKIILTDEVAVRYSWTGLKKTIKFSDHKVVDGIIETIMKNYQTTLIELQNAVREWLRHAGDRVRYQQKKEMKAVGKYL